MTAPSPQGTAQISVLANTLTPSATLAAGIVEGEMLIAQFVANGNPTVASTSGYTSLISVNNGTTSKQEIFYKIAGASETACAFTQDISLNTTITHFRVGTARRWGTPYDPASPPSAVALSSATVAGFTTAENEELLMLFVSWDGGKSTDTPVGMTEFYDGTGGSKGAAMSYEARPTIGDTGSRVAAAGSGGAIGIAILVALKRSQPQNPIGLSSSIITVSD